MWPRIGRRNHCLNGSTRKTLFHFLQNALGVRSRDRCLKDDNAIRLEDERRVHCTRELDNSWVKFSPLSQRALIKIGSQHLLRDDGVLLISDPVSVRDEECIGRQARVDFNCVDRPSMIGQIKDCGSSASFPRCCCPTRETSGIPATALQPATTFLLTLYM